MTHNIKRRYVSAVLIIAVILAFIAGPEEICASDGITEEIVEMTEDTAVQAEQVENHHNNEVVSETVRTTPVDGQTSDLPSGVTSETYATVPVDNETGSLSGTDTVELIGNSSMPDPGSLGLYSDDVINMVMPVMPETVYDFVMDPADLLSRYGADGAGYEKSSLYFANTDSGAGHSGISDVAMAKNKSSVPVLLYVTLEVENRYGWDVNYTSMEDVEQDSERNISFALIPVSMKDKESFDNKAADPSASDETADTVETDGQNVTDTAADLPYIMNKDGKVDIDKDGKAEIILYLDGTRDNFDIVDDMLTAKEDAVWSSLGFAVTGALNTGADWSGINQRSAEGEKLRLRVTYRMDLLSDDQAKQVEEGIAVPDKDGLVDFAINDDADYDTEAVLDEISEIEEDLKDDKTIAER